MKRDYMMYNEIFLGAKYSCDSTCFNVWSPQADSVKLNLYKSGDGDTKFKSLDMTRNYDGIWSVSENGDLNKVYYTYEITYGNKVVESHDPYAVACGVNGDRSMVIDLSLTDPVGFLEDKGPRYSNKTDVVVMEISIADSTGDASSNVKNKGKYLGLTEVGVKSDENIPTGIDYICDLGITHVQIMPSYDFASIDEANTDEEQYNWGYDPYNYNVPEGSYSTDPFNGEVRIEEFKKMIMSIHSKGLGVIMDVVYNHVYDIDGSCFQKTNPDYYFRMKNEEYSDASACGNEFASDMPMARKYIIDSLCYWAKEYHIDGFRFDLMGVLDIETMNQAATELKKINPDIILYGEGWTGGDSTLPADERALKCNTNKLNDIGAFSDDFRDAVKGHVFDLDVPGFVNGAPNMEELIKNCIIGCDWANRADQIVNYVSCHDNLTLWDKFILSSPKSTEAQWLKMNKLAAAITMTTQGIPFFQMGEEFGRTKHTEDGEIQENSYNLPLYVNSIKYNEAYKNKNLIDYYKGLIDFRKHHASLRLNEIGDIKDAITFIKVNEKNVVAYKLKTSNEELLIVFNANAKKIEFVLPDDNEWTVYINGEKSGNYEIDKIKNQTRIDEISCLVAVKN